jgi:ABC-type uncharacterized transport system permease subunit
MHYTIIIFYTVVVLKCALFLAKEIRNRGADRAIVANMMVGALFFLTIELIDPAMTAARQSFDIFNSVVYFVVILNLEDRIAWKTSSSLKSRQQL